MDLQLLSQCGSTLNCLSRSAPEMHSHVAGTLNNQQTNLCGWTRRPLPFSTPPRACLSVCLSAEKATIAVFTRLLTVPATCRVYLWDGSARTVVRTAALRWCVQIKLALSPSGSVLTLGQPFLALTVQRQESCVAVIEYRGPYHGGGRPSSDNSFHSPTVIPPSALDKPSIMKR